MSTTSDREYDEYRKTCSIIFGKANASQLQYPSASIELQQMWLTSCDSVVANQINWLEKYVKENNASNFFVEPFLRIYASMVDLCMSLCFHIIRLWNIIYTIIYKNIRHTQPTQFKN